jgi:ABC-type nitrate/sulfonate/bicarbonate transport system permease component
VTTDVLVEARPDRAAARKSARPGVVRAAKGIAGVLVVIALWEVVRALGFVDRRDLPSIASIAAAGARDLADGPLLDAVGGSLRAWGLGLLLATAGGVAAGLLLGLVPKVEVLTRPVLEFIRPIPSVALVPVALIVLGLGFRMEVALIAFASVWPVLFSAKAGVEGVDPRYLETGRILGLGRLERVRRIVVPAAMPSMATGVRTAAAIALVLAITVELVTGQPGIGLYLQTARVNGQVPETWAAIVLAGLLGYGLNTAFLAVERRVLGWSQEHRVQ